MSQVSLLTGAIWGIVGAITMVVVMRAIGGSAPPPFAVFWARFIDDGDPSKTMPQSLIIHAIYAVIAGVVYVLVFTRFDLGVAITTVTGGVLWGIVWAVVLFVVGAVFWGAAVLDMAPDREQMMSMGLAHLAYGLVLGVLSAAVPQLL